MHIHELTWTTSKSEKGYSLTCFTASAFLYRLNRFTYCRDFSNTLQKVTQTPKTNQNPNQISLTNKTVQTIIGLQIINNFLYLKILIKLATFTKIETQKADQLLTGRLGSWDHQTSAEAARTCAQESEKPRSSSNTWPWETLPKNPRPFSIITNLYNYISGNKGEDSLPSPILSSAAFSSSSPDMFNERAETVTET